MSRFAIIDCGTNTFNLLIADFTGLDDWKKVHESSIPVNLSPKGSSKNIAAGRIHRALDAMMVYKNNIINYRVNHTFAFATAAFRTSENGQNLVQAIKEHTGIVIEIISGDQEAQLIYQGVQLLNLLDKDNSLIMDIGGGSTEFIISNKDSLLWKESFPIGVSRIFNDLKISSKLDPKEITEIQNYIVDRCATLWEALTIHRPKKLIGTAGTFNTMSTMIFGQEKLFEKDDPHKISNESYQELRDVILDSTLDERLMMEGLLPFRAPFIPCAFIEIDLILERSGISEIIQSPFALKEGALLYVWKKSQQLN